MGDGGEQEDSEDDDFDLNAIHAHRRLPEDILMPQSIYDPLPTSEQLEEVLSGNFEVAHAMDQMMETSLLDPETSLLPHENRLESSGSSKRPLDEDVSEGQTSTHGALSSNEAEGSLIVRKFPKRARRDPIKSLVLSITAIYRAFGPQQYWPASTEIAIPPSPNDLYLRIFSRQIGTKLQFGNAPPYNARFDGVKWIRNPGVRFGKKHWRIITTHRGIHERGSEILARLVRWDAKKNLVRYVPKDAPHVLTPQSNAKGKMPVYKVQNQSLANGSSYTSHPDQRGRIDSAVGDVQTPSTTKQSSSKRKRRKWIIDINAGQLKRIPCTTSRIATSKVDMRFLKLAMLRKQCQAMVQSQYGAMLPCQYKAMLQNKYKSMLRSLSSESDVAPLWWPHSPINLTYDAWASNLRARLQQGERNSWNPETTKETMPGPFDPFAAAQISRRLLDNATSISAVQTEAGSTSSANPQSNATTVKPDELLNDAPQDKSLLDLKMVKDLDSPDLAGTLAPKMDVSEFAAMGLGKSGTQAYDTEKTRRVMEKGDEDNGAAREADSQLPSPTRAPNVSVSRPGGIGSREESFDEGWDTDMDSDSTDIDTDINFRSLPIEMILPCRERRRGPGLGCREELPWASLRGGSSEEESVDEDVEDEYSSSDSSSDEDVEDEYSSSDSGYDRPDRFGQGRLLSENRDNEHERQRATPEVEPLHRRLAPLTTNPIDPQGYINNHLGREPSTSAAPRGSLQNLNNGHNRLETQSQSHQSFHFPNLLFLEYNSNLECARFKLWLWNIISRCRQFLWVDRIRRWWFCATTSTCIHFQRKRTARGILPIRRAIQDMRLFFPILTILLQPLRGHPVLFFLLEVVLAASLSAMFFGSPLNRVLRLQLRSPLTNNSGTHHAPRLENEGPTQSISLASRQRQPSDNIRSGFSDAIVDRTSETVRAENDLFAQLQDLPYALNMEAQGALRL